MKIKRVFQPDPNRGCAFACLAMVRGVSFEEVKDDFSLSAYEEGLSVAEMSTYLIDHGYTVGLKQMNSWNDPQDGREWMAEPFADVHILSVQDFADSLKNHALVMTSEGTILNPTANGLTDLFKYFHVMNCLGIWRPKR